MPGSRLRTLLAVAVVGAGGVLLAVDAKKEPHQMVDSKARLSSATAGYVSESMTKLSDGRQLQVVASLGPRRLGKSALINQVFGTKFDDEAEPGVWICPSSANKDVLCVNPLAGDAAGGDLTHKKLATLCASLADVLVVNTWHSSSGRPTTATVETLTALFAEQLRQASDGGGVQRSLVLFAVHGVDPEDGEQSSPAALQAQVEAIWAGMPKPAGLEGARLEDYYDFEYAPVPHYRASAAAFKDAAAQLRARMRSDGGLIKADYTKAIDAENFGVLAEQIWNDARSDSDDGLAVTRDQMRACFVASRALFDATDKFDRQVARWSAAVAKKRTVPAFGRAGKELYAGTLAAFDAATAACGPGDKVVAAQRSKLVAHMKGDLSRLFNDQVRILHAETMTRLREVLLLTVARQGSIQDWQVANTQTSVERYFTQRLAELVIPELALNLVPVKAELSQRLAQFGARFASSATLQVQALQHLADKAKAGKQPKGPRGVSINYALTGAVRTAGTGNLQSFASYANGPYQLNFMLANDRDLPESAASTGVAPPTLRLQPKINFDVDL